MFPHSTAQWTIPTVTGDVPYPMVEFSFTQISRDRAVLFGRECPGYDTGTCKLQLATVSRDSVVSVSELLLSCSATVSFEISG